MADLSKRKEVVGFIGAGNMAGALIRGLASAGLQPAQIFVSDLDETKTKALKTELGVVVSPAEQLVKNSDVVILAVKPHTIAAVAESHRSLAAGRLWISVAAGVETDAIESALGDQPRVIRAMPNTPALIGLGATGICRGTHATDDDLETAEALLGAVGITAIVDEGAMDAVTALSGSGPAFIMLVVESMTDGAVRAGLPRKTAQALAAQTVRGAAALVQQTGKHPGELKDMVTSPGGTTIAGIEALEAAGLRTAFISAVNAAFHRAKKLGGK